MKGVRGNLPLRHAHGFPSQHSISRNRKCGVARHATSQTKEPVTKKSKTQEIFELLEERKASGQQAGGAGGGTTYKALKGADAAWSKLRNMQAPSGEAPTFVRNSSSRLGQAPEYDVCMCGGTLGVFLACVLQLQGFRVAIVERGPLKGRSQEWNLSRKEVGELVEQGLLTWEEAEECITSEFNPVRAGFHQGVDVWTRDVLNIGIRPDRIIAKVRQRFEDAGGKVLEFTAATGVQVHPNGCALQIPKGEESSEKKLTARLLIDCMGNASPIVGQMRWGQKPDGICLVVGTCARGFPEQSNTTGDVIYTRDSIQSPRSSIPDMQLFWEAFPAGSKEAGRETDRTSYMFSYLDSKPNRPSLEEMLEAYWELMPQYQNVSLDRLEVLRILFGFFPTYRASPLQPQFDRVLQVGDASGIQSPLSFGGFGALSRHLPRLRAAITDALKSDCLDRRSLACINSYNPGLSGAWMLQRAMSVRPNRQPDSQFINTLLSANFQMMEGLGDPVLKPFLQDVVQWRPLALTLAKQMAAEPGFIPQILGHVGVGPILDWTRHFVNLGLYTVLFKVFKPLDGTISSQLSPVLKFRWQRTLEAWEYGSGMDYRL